MKDFLFICSLCGAFLIFSIIFMIVNNIFNAITKRKKCDWKLINWKECSEKQCVFYAIILICSIVGLIYSFKVNFMHDHKIGSVTEERSYEENYEALLEYDGKTIPCIAYVFHESGTYIIADVVLPFGKHEYQDMEYDPEEKENYIYLGEDGYTVYIKLGEVASEKSFENLQNAVVSKSGTILADINTDICHFDDCSYAKSIKAENRIRFDTIDEAKIFGYKMCKYCWNNE